MAASGNDRHLADGAPPVARGNPRSPRCALSLDCEARQGLQPWLRVRLHDLSESGFRLTWPAPHFNPRQPIRLRIPGMQLLSADVRWHKPGERGTTVGAQFATAMHVAVFQHVIARARARS
jgi:hypothetical protein